MKRLKKGFTLIELLVVIAIIGILATTLAPKLREQLAKAKDSKAIAVLGASRTAGSVVFIDSMINGGTTTDIYLDDIFEKLDSNSQKIIGTVTADQVVHALTVGGIRASKGAVIGYGGTINLTLATLTTTSDSIDLALDSAASTQASTEDKVWNTY